MSLIEVRNEDQFNHIIGASQDPVLVGFFGAFSAASKRAEEGFRQFSEDHPVQPTVLVDVEAIKGLHKRFGVSSVPTVISVTKRGEVVQKVIGEQPPGHYERAFLTQAQVLHRDGDESPRFPNVTIWTSDTCSWCTRTKNYLRQHRVPFSEINVSRDPSAAQRLQSMTGQMGVPQLDIGGSYVVGFDKAKIDRLLGLPSGAQA